ncbi:hypothetical protein E4S40_14625 [Algoriphagus kandeliae]|uniref:Prenyltransferase n=1 Tax=Algoriphagus kandeliae TaxID=2562278 RepID=A0A4Y9QLB2_9BACT|nr:hypothetical protein [Algoriphagus kandeliae]TFV93481.1 hypothetical protein E4S40_14625 [Algoriphagus kandeliae]
MGKIIRWISWLSIDVVLGAVAGMLFFSKLFHVALPWQPYVLLGMAVWCIYNLDHLLDAQKVGEKLSGRRQFHHQARVPVLIVIGILGLLGLVGGFWWFGWGLELQWTFLLGGLIGGIRFLVLKFGKGWMKEFSIALFYVIGISWLPFLRSNSLDWSAWHGLFFLLYLLLANLNLLILSFLDQEEDQLAGFFSVSQELNTVSLILWIKYLMYGLLILLILVLVIIPSFYKLFVAILFLMTLCHWYVFNMDGVDSEKKRIGMEWAFFLPVLLIFLK